MDEIKKYACPIRSHQEDNDELDQDQISASVFSQTPLLITTFLFSGTLGMIPVSQELSSVYGTAWNLEGSSVLPHIRDAVWVGIHHSCDPQGLLLSSMHGKEEQSSQEPFLHCAYSHTTITIFLRITHQYPKELKTCTQKLVHKCLEQHRS